MTEIPEDARNVSPEDRKRGEVFFGHARTVADTGNYEYAIEMYIQGLSRDPENMEAHKAAREISLLRKARGGKAMGFMERGKLPKAAKTDFKQQMLNAEKQLGYDPGNTDHMAAMAVAAQKASYFDVVRWIGPELLRANASLPKPDFNKFVVLKDVYKNSMEFKKAAEACEYAARMKPMDQNLQHEARMLATEETIKAGGYNRNESFTGSIRDRDSQQRLIDEQKDVRSEDALTTAINEARKAYDASPNDAALLKKLVEALKRTEQTDNENLAIELLDAQYKRTGQYPFKDLINSIKLTQLNRLDRSLRENIKAEPTNAELVKEYQRFTRDKTEEELAMYKEKIEVYPTLTEAKFEMAKRMFLLGQFEDVIPVFQEVRNDPKYKITASIALGRSFLESDFVDEAIDTLGGVLADYATRGDDRSKELTYWYARALEQKGEIPAALKNFSQVFQWEAKYRDVQVRIKHLRSGGGPTPGTGK